MWNNNDVTWSPLVNLAILALISLHIQSDEHVLLVDITRLLGMSIKFSVGLVLGNRSTGRFARRGRPPECILTLFIRYLSDA